MDNQSIITMVLIAVALGTAVIISRWLEVEVSTASSRPLSPEKPVTIETGKV
jgi:hypothetical protein